MPTSNQPDPQEGAPRSVGRTLLWWALGAFIGAAAAGGVALVTTQVIIPLMAEAPLVADLTGAEGAAFTARVEDGALLITPAAPSSASNALEAWLIVDGRGPALLGDLDATGELSLSLGSIPPEALQGATVRIAPFGEGPDIAIAEGSLAPR